MDRNQKQNEKNKTKKVLNDYKRERENPMGRQADRERQRDEI